MVGRSRRTSSCFAKFVFRAKDLGGTRVCMLLMWRFRFARYRVSGGSPVVKYQRCSTQLSKPPLETQSRSTSVTETERRLTFDISMVTIPRKENSRDEVRCRPLQFSRTRTVQLRISTKSTHERSPLADGIPAHEPVLNQPLAFPVMA